MFSGNTLGRCASAGTEDNNYAAQLESSMSEGESPRISGSPGQAEKLCYKTSPTTWLSQVNDQWEHVLYEAGADWKNNALPDEAKALLANGDDLEKMVRERNWINFSSLAEAWRM